MIPAPALNLITLAMFVFIGTWSDFLWPLVILDDPVSTTLPAGLQQAGQQLLRSTGGSWPPVSVVSTCRLLLLFPVLLQRYILPVASGDAVKGDPIESVLLTFQRPDPGTLAVSPTLALVGSTFLPADSEARHPMDNSPGAAETCSHRGSVFFGPRGLRCWWARILEIPAPLPKLFSPFLLLAIGFRGWRGAAAKAALASRWW